MRKMYDNQLGVLHERLIQMGALCETAIACAVQALLNDDDALRSATKDKEQEIDLAERDIEQLCVRLLIHQQPMASDLRQITAAQKMIIDMERIGDQAADIAEISSYMQGSTVKSDVHMTEMARCVSKMVTDSIDAFVSKDFAQAQAVIDEDDIADALFSKIKTELIDLLLRTNGKLAEDCLDLLMIAKYFERIGDHATNIAEWVIYYLTGNYKKQNV
ncbi:MAG: phosphate signaling complex protein PhoU [Peptococcaceae bacterium]|jgi:phosphate transport system protein|nr:phosphate signaling complex protein PhoU [Peptococcaceae bacterium]